MSFLTGNWLRMVVYAAVIASILTTVWFHGLFTGRAALVEYKAEQAMKAAKVIVKRGKATERVIIQYVKVKGETKVKKETIEKEVVRYVDSGIDSCPLSRGAVSLHDSAAANEVPNAARSIDGTPSGLETSALTETCTENYATYHETADRLRALQNWIREQQRIP